MLLWQAQKARTKLHRAAAEGGGSGWLGGGKRSFLEEFR